MRVNGVDFRFRYFLREILNDETFEKDEVYQEIVDIFVVVKNFFAYPVEVISVISFPVQVPLDVI